MKNNFKSYAWISVGGAVVAVMIFMFAQSLSPHRNLAQNPKSLEEITGLDLPEIAHAESEDNLDRSASCWDCYTHRLQFAEPLSGEQIKVLEGLCQTDAEHWTKVAEDESYVYRDSDSDLYEVGCTIYKDRSSVSYMVEETEGIFAALPFLLIGYLVAFLAVVSAIIAVVRWCKEAK